jgi:hypothetical protein
LNITGQNLDILTKDKNAEKVDLSKGNITQISGINGG